MNKKMSSICLYQTFDSSFEFWSFLVEKTWNGNHWLEQQWTCHQFDKRRLFDIITGWFSSTIWKNWLLKKKKSIVYRRICSWFMALFNILLDLLRWYWNVIAIGVEPGGFHIGDIGAFGVSFPRLFLCVCEYFVLVLHIIIRFSLFSNIDNNVNNFGNWSWRPWPIRIATNIYQKIKFVSEMIETVDCAIFDFF